VFATLHHFRRPVADVSPAWGATLAEELHGTRPIGSCTLAELGGIEGAVVAFWPAEADAAAAVDRRTPDGPVWLDAVAYRVVEAHAGVDRDRPPRFAQRTCFDGPRSRAQADAAERAGRDRIWPAVRDLPGIVAVHVLRDPQNGVVVLGLTTTVETHEAVQRAVFATELLPGEDPALLTEPDRVHIDRVLRARLPEPAMAGEPA
jgi:hypothetical protein